MNKKRIHDVTYGCCLVAFKHVCVDMLTTFHRKILASYELKDMVNQIKNVINSDEMRCFSIINEGKEKKKIVVLFFWVVWKSMRELRNWKKEESDKFGQNIVMCFWFILFLRTSSFLHTFLFPISMHAMTTKRCWIMNLLSLFQ